MKITENLASPHMSVFFNSTNMTSNCIHNSKGSRKRELFFSAPPTTATHPPPPLSGRATEKRTFFLRLP